MTEENQYYKDLYEKGLITIDALDKQCDELKKQNDGLQLLIQDKDKEAISFAEWIKGWIELDNNSEWISNEGDNYTSKELYLKFTAVPPT